MVQLEISKVSIPLFKIVCNALLRKLERICLIILRVLRTFLMKFLNIQEEQYHNLKVAAQSWNSVEEFASIY